MTSPPITRAAFVAALAALGAFAAAPPAHAARDLQAEAYVQANAAEALRTLGDSATSRSQRQATFNRLMSQFADMPRIASFVLGRYSAQLNSDAALRRAWMQAFQDYSIAVYETQLDRYSGGAVRVVNSVERTRGTDVIVECQITPRGANRGLPVRWRLKRSGEAWRVVDISLLVDGNELWMAQQQQRDFLAALDRNGGDVRALMTLIQTQTAEMRSRLMARG